MQTKSVFLHSKFQDVNFNLSVSHKAFQNMRQIFMSSQNRKSFPDFIVKNKDNLNEWIL